MYQQLNTDLAYCYQQLHTDLAISAYNSLYYNPYKCNMNGNSKVITRRHSNRLTNNVQLKIAVPSQAKQQVQTQLMDLCAGQCRIKEL